LFGTKLCFQDRRPDLFDLVRLRVRTCPLQVNSLLDPALPEQVMAAPHAFLETQTLEQLAQIVKADGCVGGTAEKASERFSAPITDILHGSSSGL
jgi:hypothetical protein